MPKKYKLICLGISAIFLIWYGLNDEETTLSTKIDQLPVVKARKKSEPANLAENDDMVAAILIMPKAYLPALEKFSNSTMAKDMMILRAQIEYKDGQMTAIYNKKEKHPQNKTTPVNRLSTKQNEVISEKLPEIEKQVLAAGFICFLAGIHKKKILR